MRSNYKKLGDYIRPVDERNSDLAITNLQGVSITKEFVPSIANIIGTDLSTYKIVRTGQFAYGPVTSRNGDKVSIALLKGEDCIISSSYSPFEVYKPDELLPEYLMLWFMRPEFDRYARFMSNGSAREVFDWDCMCGLELPIPPLTEQREIVRDYHVFTDRISLLQRINENLDEQLSAFYEHCFIDINDRYDIDEISGLPKGWEEKRIGDSGLDISDGNYSAKYPKYNEFVPRGIPFIRGTDFVGKFISTRKVLHITTEKHVELKKGHTKRGDLLISTRGEIGKVVFLPDSLIDVNINSQLVRINGNGVLPRSYLAYALFSDKVQKELKSLITGSVQEQLPIGKLEQAHLLFPSKDEVDQYCQVANPIIKLILENSEEINNLMDLLDLLLSRISVSVG